MTPPRPASRLDRLAARLHRPVDGASLGVFRLAFGSVLAWHFVSDVTSGRLELSYLRPHFFFKYPGFGWVEPLPDAAMVGLYWGLAAVSLLVASGLFYRLGATLLFAGFTYTFLLDQARYQNHLYLTVLLCFLLIFIPAHRCFSLDASRRPGDGQGVPAWAVSALRFQLGLVFVFGGVAKLDDDWLLRAQPMRIWLEQQPPGTLRLPFFAEPWVGYLLSWGGLVLDLAIVPFLLWRRTRVYAFVLGLAFHLTNSQLFNIGYFPLMMALATTIFFSPGWPRRLRFFGPAAVEEPGTTPLRWSRRRRIGWIVACLYVAAQLLAPLRHWAIPGDVGWTEEGHRFSWRMKLRDKQGSVQLFWLHPDGSASPLDPATVLTPFQQRKLVIEPARVHQLVLAVADGLRRKGQADVDIRVLSRVSLNGRPPQGIVDPGTNLAAIPPSLFRDRWILPLRESAD